MSWLAAGAIVKKLLGWIGELSLSQLIALVLGLICVWQFVTIHGIEFKLIPGLGPKIHIVSLQGKIDAANADAKDAHAQLATSINNERLLRATIADQNQRLQDLGNQSAQQQVASKQAEAKALSRARAAEAARDRLRRSGSQRPAGPVCEPSATLKRQWS